MTSDKIADIHAVMQQFSQTLKSWRTARRFSQLDLALEAEISTRHLSFLETGRSQPSRNMIERLSDALQLPLDARNQMLTHAGFAVRYKTRQWGSAEMAPIRTCVDLMLENHMPYPGIALDRLWSIRQMNPAAKTLYGAFGCGVGDSLIDLLMSDALPQAVENWPEVAQHAALRLRTESLVQGGVTELDKARQHLMGITGRKAIPPGPVIPTILRMGPHRLSLIATISQFGTPEDVTLDDLKIELYFPADDTTAQILHDMAN